MMLWNMTDSHYCSRLCPFVWLDLGHHLPSIRCQGTNPFEIANELNKLPSQKMLDIHVLMAAQVVQRKMAVILSVALHQYFFSILKAISTICMGLNTYHWFCLPGSKDLRNNHQWSLKIGFHTFELKTAMKYIILLLVHVFGKTFFYSLQYFHLMTAFIHIHVSR